MPQSTRDIKRRIRSITNTKKITKAMEMVAAAKMRKAVERVQMTKEYARSAWELAQDLAERVDASHPLLARRPLTHVAFTVISSNKGLCGGFNREIAERALATAQQFSKRGIHVSFITLGRKGASLLAARKMNLIADFKKEDIATAITEFSSVYKTLVDDFTNGTYDAVFLVYTDFRSTLQQVPSVVQLLPIIPHPDAHLGKVKESASDDNPKRTPGVIYTFEPSPEYILDNILPRLVAIELFQGALESNACEHSARMMAMKNASKSAGEMVDYLNLMYNRARQAGITQEIAEIAAGRTALS